jgi:hypothetical protein
MRSNVTEIFQRYRQCLRDIWNVYFWRDPDRRNWNSVSVFERLKPCIFHTLVFESLADRCACEPSHVAGRFEIVPNMPDSEGARLATHVIVTKKEREGRSWKEELVTLKASEVTLDFVDVFDWTMMGYVDFRYYVAKIVRLENRSDLVGFEALIEVSQAEVIWVDERTEDEGDSLN